MKTTDAKILAERGRRGPLFVRFAALGLALFLAALWAAPAGQQAPPESREIQAARRIEDLALRIKELERIKAAYPQSRLMTTIERNLLDAKVALCETVEEVDLLQRPLLGQGSGFDRLDAYYYACDRVLDHRNIDRFDRARVTAIVESYVAD